MLIVDVVFVVVDWSRWKSTLKNTLSTQMDTLWGGGLVGWAKCNTAGKEELIKTVEDEKSQSWLKSVHQLTWLNLCWKRGDKKREDLWGGKQTCETQDPDGCRCTEVTNDGGGGSSYVTLKDKTKKRRNKRRDEGAKEIEKEEKKKKKCSQIGTLGGT